MPEFSQKNFPYYHELKVTLNTQFPETPLTLEAMVEQLLGPWCVKVESIELNLKVEF